MRAHLKPTAPIAADAVLPSDPGDALLLAQHLFDAPLMSNHSHGLWGYHGHTASGRSLTVQSTGIGGPSAAIVLAELRELGVRRAIRIGVCAPLQDGAAPGDAVVAERALTRDGTSAALGARGAVSADAVLTAALGSAAGPSARTGAVASADLLDGSTAPSGGALALDLESGALFAVADRLGLAVGAVLMVGSPAGSREPDPDAPRLGRIAARALEAAAAERAQAPPRESGIPSRA